MIIFDNHMHLRRDGMYINAVKEFKKAGGTHIVLCQYPMIKTLLNTKKYDSIYNDTIKMAQEIQEKTDITVYTTVGPYPVDYIRLKDKFGRLLAIDIMKSGMDLAAKFCQEKKCIAIGEIGRPHFPVEKEIFDDSNEIMIYGMQKAKEVNVPVVLHTESTTPQQCKELSEMGTKVGLSADKIVKHFSPALINYDENYGLMPSVLASKRNILESIKKGNRFMMETDYIDDPRRPGAVLGPKTIPKRTLDLYENQIFSDQDVYMIHKNIPEKTYDIILEE